MLVGFKSFRAMKDIIQKPCHEEGCKMGNSWK